ncbi:ATP-binding protein [Reichenbachiella agarivorans]|uniref:histidine kinase n=1 Tax=Reichenbachiella agarivorans TaxID=2979464 RepID=A0ABY6CL31_9BACT|nr:ATP-binding protein [Reichenbachiella agarivorans]UXP31197.1 ATP-binding protein [Reichenbachiella agarivorans]
MVYNRFFLKVVLRVLMMLAVMVVFSAIFLREDLLYSQLVLVIVLVFQIMELVFFINKTNYDLARFVSSILNEDFTISFNQSEKVKSFDQLYASLNQFVGRYRGIQTAKAGQFHFLTQLVDQIEFGIITFDEQQQITLMNRQAQSLLEIPAVSNWQNLHNPNTQFLKVLFTLSIGKNQLIETKIGEQQRYFSVSVTTVFIQENKYTIASFQDIKSEIQGKEIAAWHKIIRILTHEIMNSVTPMVSLTETVQMILQDDNKEDKPLESLSQENIQDVNEALLTIKERSKGILKFVNSYRKLAKSPKPVLSPVSTQQLIQGILKLMETQLKECGIKMTVVHADVILSIDHSLISQVLINLMKNAIESLGDTEKPTIEISTRQQGDCFHISISDNGMGISVDRMDKIFVPFYTTKIDGSGIGLSLSRQIMDLHGGYLEVTSIPNERTSFSLIFPNY